jgi:hypothetical protein
MNRLLSAQRESVTGTNRLWSGRKHEREADGW